MHKFIIQSKIGGFHKDTKDTVKERWHIKLWSWKTFTDWVNEKSHCYDEGSIGRNNWRLQTKMYLHLKDNYNKANKKV